MAIRWKPIPGCDGFKASSNGRVRKEVALRGHVPVTITLGPRNRLLVHLRRNGYGQQVLVEKLVGELFCEDWAPKKVAVFKDGNSLNVNPSNMRWVSRSEYAKIKGSTNKHQNGKTCI